MTNSPIESYNNIVKESFTKRVKHHLKTAVEIFQDVVSYESNHGREFKSEVRVRKYMREQAKTIVRKNQLIARDALVVSPRRSSRLKKINIFLYK